MNPAFTRTKGLYLPAFIILLTVEWHNLTAATFDSNTATGNWNAAATWLLTSGTDADGIPDADDDVTIKTGHTITLSDTRGCNALTVETGATFVLNSSLTQDGAFLSQGTVDWTGGTFAGTGAITNDGTLNLNTTSNHNTGANITNNAGKTMNWNFGHIDSGAGGQVLTNFGTLYLIGDNPNSYACQMPIVNKNGGTIVKGGTTSATLTFVQNLTNESGGTVTVNSGATLQFQGGNLSNDGTFSVAGTIVFISGSHTFNPGGSFGGTGILNISNTTTVTASGGFAPAFPTVTHTGTLNAGAGTSLTILNGTTWNWSGDFGAFTSITNDGTLNVNNNANHNSGASITNNAGKTMNWNFGHIDSGAGGQVLTNFGTLNLIGDNPNSYACQMPIVNKNGGTIVKGGTTSASVTQSQPFTNESGGTVSVGAGATIVFNNVALTQGGTFTVDGGITLTNVTLTQTQPFTINGTCSITTNGTYSFGANSGFGGTGLLTLSSGTCTFNAGCTFSTSLTQNSGTINDNIGLAPPQFILTSGTYQGTGSPAPGSITQSGGTFQPDGTVTLSGNLSISGSSSIFDPDGNTSVGGTLTWSAGSIGTSGAGSTASTLNVVGVTTFTSGVSSMALNKKTLNINGGAAFTGSGTTLTLTSSATLHLPGGQEFTDGIANSHSITGGTGNTFNLAGTYQKTGTGTLNMGFGLFNNTGAVNVTGGILNFSGNSTQSGSLTNAVADGINFQSGTHTLTGPSISGSGSLRVSGGTVTMSSDLVQSLSMTSGAFNGAFNTNAGSISLTSAGAPNFSPNGSVTLSGNLTLTSFGVFDPDGNTTVGGTLTWSSGDIGANSAGTTPSTVDITGLTTFTALGYSPAIYKKTLNLNGGASFTGITGNINLQSGSSMNLPSGQNFTDLVSSPHSIFGGGGSNFNVAGTFTKTGSGALTININSLLNNTGTLTLSTGTISLSNYSGNGYISVANGTTLSVVGNVNYGGSLFTNNGTVSGSSFVFAGAAQQTLEGTGSIQSFTVNNAADLNLTGSQSVSGTLTFTSGKIYLQNNDLPVGTISGASASRYFVTFGTGRLVQTAPVFPATKLFAVGPSTESYNPVTLAQVNGAGTAGFGVRAKIGFDHPIGGADYVNRQWTIDHLSGTANTNVTVQWEDAHTEGMFDEADCHLARWNGANWDSFGSGPTQCPSVCTRTANGVMAFSPFGVGSGTALLLPVELLSFGGQLVGGDALLTWRTASEQNNEGFHVEKSTDGIDFQSVAFVPGAGTSFLENGYEHLDRDFVASAFYRLRQTDFDGSAAFSNVIFLKKEDGAAGKTLVYPSPSVDGFFHLVLPEGAQEIMVLDGLGKLVAMHRADAPAMLLDLSDEAAGGYSLFILGEEGVMERMRVVRG